jgi:sec-independent protein translocase protein TatA
MSMLPPPTLAFIGNLRGMDLLVIAFFALLIFGRRLPEIGKNIGRSVVEFKKGLKSGSEDEKPKEELEEEAPRKQIASAKSKRMRASSDEP